QGVSDVELVQAFLVAGELPLQGAAGRVQPLAVQREVQGRGHLVGGGAAGAGVGHGQGAGDAVRREEQVALLLSQLAVEVAGEGRVVFDHDGQVAALRLRLRRGGGGPRSQQGQRHGRPGRKTEHGVLLVGIGARTGYSTFSLLRKATNSWRCWSARSSSRAISARRFSS